MGGNVCRRGDLCKGALLFRIVIIRLPSLNHFVTAQSLMYHLFIEDVLLMNERDSELKKTSGLCLGMEGIASSQERALAAVCRVWWMGR